MKNMFKPGTVYVATSAIEGARRRLGVVLGREGRLVQLAFIDELTTGEVAWFNGRESVKVSTRTGEYNLSSAVRAEAGDAAMVMDILRKEYGYAQNSK